MIILDRVYYPVIHFCRVIIYVVWRSSFVVSLSLACTLGGTYALCVSLDATLLVICSSYHLFKTLSPSFWRGCFNTLVQWCSSTSWFALTCHRTGARLSLRAIGPSPGKKNSGLTNPRWRMYIEFLERDSKHS